MLEEQCHKMQRQHKEKKLVKAKVRKETKKQEFEKEEKKKKWMEYLQQLQNEVLVKDAALLKSVKESQIMGSKCKEVTSENNKKQWPSKKAKEKKPEKYYRNARVKMRDDNPCVRLCMC